MLVGDVSRLVVARLPSSCVLAGVAGTLVGVTGVFSSSLTVFARYWGVCT